MDRIGSLVACSSVPARGFMAFAGAVALTVASVAGVLTGGDAVSLDAAASVMAVVSPAARLAAGSEAALAGSTAVEVSTVVAAAFTAAGPTGVDTGNCAETYN
jgi:hypothetical protein